MMIARTFAKDSHGKKIEVQVYKAGCNLKEEIRKQDRLDSIQRKKRNHQKALALGMIHGTAVGLTKLFSSLMLATGLMFGFFIILNLFTDLEWAPMFYSGLLLGVITIKYRKVLSSFETDKGREDYRFMREFAAVSAFSLAEVFVVAFTISRLCDSAFDLKLIQASIIILMIIVKTSYLVSGKKSKGGQ